MTWLLIAVVAAVMLAFTIQGFRVGLLRRLVEFAGAIGSFLLATSRGPLLAMQLEKWPGLHGRVALYVAWIVLFVAGLIVTWLLALAASRAIQVTFVGSVDRLGGAACGLLLGTLLASLILLAASRAPGGAAVRETFCAHPATRLVYRAAPSLYDGFRKLGLDRGRIWQEIAGTPERLARPLLRPLTPPSAFPAAATPGTAPASSSAASTAAPSAAPGAATAPAAKPADTTAPARRR
jgi:uncharacterized membrane protein required for colicin V production